jgi:hypothetical protein
MSSCRQNIVLFDEKGDSYLAYSSSTKKRWKYCWQHCVTYIKYYWWYIECVKLHIVVAS